MTPDHRTPSEPRGFHIHIDAQHLPAEPGRYAIHDLGWRAKMARGMVRSRHIGNSLVRGHG
jgi:hypothetical protein